MIIWIYALISVAIVSLISLAGVFTLSLRQEKLRSILLFMVSFSVGGLVGDAFIHLLPEAFEKISNKLVASLLVIAGMLIFFVVEKIIRWRHCHTITSDEHLHPVVTLNLIGDGVHNLIDGMVIGASFWVSIPLGIATSLAVIFHEIPQEIGDFGVLVHGGLSVKKALFFNFLSGLAAIGGVIISLLLGPHIKGYMLALLPITAGGFLYIAGSDLIPELHGCDIKVSASLLQFIFIILGVLVMALLVLLENV